MSRPRIHGIMMVYRGDEYWNAALASLADCRNVFDSLIISFDGPTRYQLADRLYEAYGDSLGAEVLITPEVLSSVEHACWIAQQESARQWSDTDLVVLLSEDDRLCPAVFCEAVAEATKLDGSALFGSWAVDCDDFSDMGTSLQIHSVEGAGIGKWLNQVARSGHPTSITATLTPVEAHRNFISILQGQSPDRPLFSGVRAEYLLLTQTPIKRILWSDQPLATIQQHEDQESKSLSRNLWMHDEALFQLWLTMAPLQLGSKSRVLAVMRLLKWISLHPPTLMDLPNGFRTLYSARRRGNQQLRRP